MRLVCTAVLLAVALAGGTALADAKQHFLAGNDYYTQGRYQKAVDEFQEAYRLDPRPLLLYNIAQTWEKLGELDKAVDAFKRFLAADPNNEDKATIESKIASLEERLTATGIVITSAEDGAAIKVDGKDKGMTPQDGVIRLSVGPHKIVVSKKGFKDFVMSVAVAAGQGTPVEVTLEPGEATPSAVGPELAEQKPGGPSEPGKQPEPVKEDQTGITAMDVVPWAICGVGAAAAVVGWGVLGGMALSAGDHDQAVIADIIGASGAVVAAAGAGWGIYNLVSGGSESNPGTIAAVAPVVGPHAAYVSAAVAF
ncbi:MAG: tetratricopeptide repeat protein [Deltaproteobacteria bacterium]|nr:tetratricopeptide repeat protein [Deltaproteobacteria bacterium]